MTPPAKIIRHKLNLSSENTDFLLGLVTAEADYKVSLLLNEKLGIGLRSIEPVIIRDHGKEPISYSRFTYIEELSDIIYYLVCNRSGHFSVSKKYPNIDYLLLIRNIDTTEDIDRIISSIKMLRDLTAVFKLDPDNQIEELITI